MREITEVHLPGVGTRYEFVSSRGERIAVVAHRTGRQELALYDRGDLDTCRTVVDLDEYDAVTLASILGGGSRACKVFAPPSVLSALPRSEVVDGLAS